MIKIKSAEQAMANTAMYFLFKTFDESKLPEELVAILNNNVNQERYTFELGSVKFIETATKKYIVVGMGESPEKITIGDYRLAAFKALKCAKSEKIDNMDVYFVECGLQKAYLYKIFAEMVVTGLYTFDKYKTKKTKCYLKEIAIIDDNQNSVLESVIEEGKNVAESVNITRYLIDEPAHYMTPKKLALEAQENGKNYGFEVELFKKSAIQKLGMNAYLDVAKGSSNKPYLIVMRYRGDKKSDKILGLVGKGLTYDTGGYSIKSTEGMKLMQTDMGGAATVIGAMTAIAKAKLELNVTAVVAACENSISSTAYRPGDILTTMSGKTILCENTDAEGRFTLVDALTYIQRKEKVTTVVDVATLTGAAGRSLGDVASLTLSNNDDLYSKLQNAADVSGEKIWRMPFFKEYDEQIKATFADYTNIGGDPGAIIAGVLLKAFVENNLPWIHIDIASVAYKEKEKYYYNEGATGYGVRMLYELAKLIQE